MCTTLVLWVLFSPSLLHCTVFHPPCSTSGNRITVSFRRRARWSFLSPANLPAGCWLPKPTWHLLWNKWHCRCVVISLNEMKDGIKDISYSANRATFGIKNRSVQLVVNLLTAVFQCKKWMVCWKWLGRRDIQSGCSDLSSGQSLVQILLVHHSSSKTIMLVF